LKENKYICIRKRNKTDKNDIYSIYNMVVALLKILKKSWVAPSCRYRKKYRRPAVNHDRPFFIEVI